MFRHVLPGLAQLRRDSRSRKPSCKQRCALTTHTAASFIEPLERRRLLSLLSDGLDGIITSIIDSLPTGSTTSSTSVPTKTTSKTEVKPQYPYRKNPTKIPGIVQAEHFDRGGEGVAYHDTSSGNAGRVFRTSDWVDLAPAKDSGGGYCVNRTTKGEWIEYTLNIPATGYYDLGVRVASLGTGGRFHLELDRARKTSMLTVPNTGGWQKWKTITVKYVLLPAGTHVLRLAMDSVGARGNVASFNWISFSMAPPAALSGLQATAVSGSSAQIRWTDTAGDETGVKIERKTGVDGLWVQIATAAAHSTSYLDANLRPQTQYFYRVRATNPGGDSAYSNEADATTPFVENAVNVQFADAIVITHGGTFSGNWQSLDPDAPAVRVDTSEPVIIENSVIRSQGDLIATSGANANITIRNTRGYGLNPNVYGQAPGRFVSAEGIVNLDVENCYLEGTRGIYVYDYHGNRTNGQTVKVLRNSAKNIDGRLSDGNGGFQANVSQNEQSQFFQINGVQNLPGVEIGWNQVVNEPNVSLVEDNISIYASSGTPASPILIHNNYIRGAYPTNAAGDSHFSGGGIMLSDGGSSWVRAYGNQVVSTTNHGIAISSGNNNEFYNNRILSCGRLADGTAIASQNVGAYVWNQDSAPFYNNVGHDNLIGWIKGGIRNDWWTPSSLASTMANNMHWADPLTPSTEANEWVFWQNKLANGGVWVGPLS